MPSLRITQPNQRSFVYRLNAEPLTIGRELDNQLILEDPRVSRRHAVVRCLSGVYQIQDQGSGNGTYLNEQRLQPNVDIPLKDGDVVRLGTSLLLFESGDKQKQPVLGDGFRQVLARVPSDVVGMAPLAVAPDSEEILATFYRRELEKKGRILRLFYDLSSKLSTVYQLNEIYEEVLAILLEVTPAARVFIYRREQSDSKQERFLQVAVRLRAGTKEKAGESKPLPISKTVFAKVANERLGVLLDDTLRSFTSESIVVNQIHSVIAAPVSGPDGLLGLIYADRQDAAEAFTPDDLDLLNAVAVQTGIAITTLLNYENLQQQLQARSRLERFLPQPAVEAILKAPEEVKLGGTRQLVTALFADVRGFTTLSENLAPELIVNLLNRYFSVASEIIFEHGGTLDKYIGDGLMALFGAPYESEQQATQAVRAAIALQRRLPEFNEELERDGFPVIQIGVGINTGPAIVGYVGSETRLDYTAIGDTINIAARLESYAKAGQIVLSETTLDLLEEAFPWRSLGTTKLKGKMKDLRLAEIAWDETREFGTEPLPEPIL